MATAIIPLREAARTDASPNRRGNETLANPRPIDPITAARNASDDEILGLGVTPGNALPSSKQLDFNWDAEASDTDRSKKSRENSQQELRSSQEQELKAAFEANPELRRAWDEAIAYRDTFSTPQEARAASVRLADLDRMDALFFSRRPEDHTELARAVAALDPSAFNSLAQAMAQLASGPRTDGGNGTRMLNASNAFAQAPTATTPSLSAQQSQNSDESRTGPIAPPSEDRSFTPAQTQFFHTANAASVEEVLGAIETQVERLLPEEISKSARNRVVGEIYRELDTTLRSNRQLTQQVREAFRSGTLDAEHQRAIVSLVAGRARQALPGVAKRVLNEWTSTIVAANQDRRARQRTAERRVDIAGSGRTGNDGRRPTSPRDIDYARMSDADILNL